MKIDYPKILKKNMLNVFKDVLSEINSKGLKEGHHLYITFDTNEKNVRIPKWLKKKFANEMTIIIQYEFWNLKIYKEYFDVSLSFNDIKTNLSISYNSVISFADPYANFGLKLSSLETSINKKNKKTLNKKKNTILKDDNKIVDLTKYRNKLN